MKIAIGQFNFTVAAIEANEKKIIEAIQEAEQAGCDLMVFPELALTGYLPEDLLLREDFQARTDLALQRITEQVGKMVVVLGHPHREENRLFNSLSILHQHKKIARYDKQKLPNYGVFDEARYFAAGNQACVLDILGKRCAFLICEDFWNPEPFSSAVKQKAEIIFVVNASPFDTQKAEQRHQIARERMSEHPVALVYIHGVGGQDELVFDGASFAMEPSGEITAQAKSFVESLFIVEYKHQKFHGEINPLPARLPSMYQALVLATRDYVHKNHFKDVLIGLSGGIDSALVLAIAVDALGADHVHAVMMPSRYTQSISIDDARQMAASLRVDYQEISIEPIYAAFLQSLKTAFNNAPENIAEENLQSRCRGTLLMALSNKFSPLILTTGNKSEIAVGYCTLYGDTAGAFDVLRDVYKTDVYALAAYRNALSPVIPSRVISRPPSAELAANQIDQNTLPPYDILDRLLQAYLEKDAGKEELKEMGFDPLVIDKVIRWVELNEYKRRQSPIGPKITPRAFGRERRYPITKG